MSSLNFFNQPYALFLSYENRLEGIVDFPVTPPEIQVNSPIGDRTFETVGLGEILLLGKRKLRTIRFSSFFPAKYYEFIVGQLPVGEVAAAVMEMLDMNISPVSGLNIFDPFEHIQAIEKMRDERKPVFFTVTESAISTLIASKEVEPFSMLCRVTEFNYKVNTGKDIYFDIQLTEYKRITATSLDLNNATGGGSAIA